MLNIVQMPGIWPEHKQWLYGLDTLLLQNVPGHLKCRSAVCPSAQFHGRFHAPTSACRPFLGPPGVPMLLGLPWSSGQPGTTSATLLSKSCSECRCSKHTFERYRDHFSALALAMSATGSLVRLDGLSQKNLFVCRPHPPTSSASSEWFELLVKQVIEKRLSCIWLQHWN